MRKKLEIILPRVLLFLPQAASRIPHALLFAARRMPHALLIGNNNSSTFTAP
jgi:hypothetical protein